MGIKQSTTWHSTTFHVRYAETDKMGVVHHSNYIVWMEEGRSALLREIGSPYTEFENEGLYLTVSEVQARYLAPAHYGQVITVSVRVAKVRSRAVSFDYKITDAQTGQALVTGQTHHVCIDHDGNVATIPPHWRQRLTGWASEFYEPRPAVPS